MSTADVAGLIGRSDVPREPARRPCGQGPVSYQPSDQTSHAADQAPEEPPDPGEETTDRSAQAPQHSHAIQLPARRPA